MVELEESCSCNVYGGADWHHGEGEEVVWWCGGLVANRNVLLCVERLLVSVERQNGLVG